MSKPLIFTVDLLRKEKFDECAVGCITNYGMAVHKPRSLKVEVSDDNKSFRQVGLRTYTDEAIFKEGNYIEDLKIEAPGTKARYVRFTLEMPVTVRLTMCVPVRFPESTLTRLSSNEHILSYRKTDF